MVKNLVFTLFQQKLQQQSKNNYYITLLKMHNGENVCV
jgi:hypothetical protein